jgi:hypothetical protein
MPDLRFSVESVSAEHNTSLRRLLFHLRVENSPLDEQIRSVSLNAQVQIQPARRRYNSEEKIALRELFGEPERWATTLHPVFWAKVSTTVSAFQGSTLVSLPVPAPSGFDDAASRYSHALREGEIPGELLFSGTIFYIRSGAPQVAFIPWSKETFCRVPLAVWRELAPLRTDAASANVAPQRTWEQILEHARALAGRSKP